MGEEWEGSQAREGCGDDGNGLSEKWAKSALNWGGGQEVSRSVKEADEAEKEIQSGYVGWERGGCVDD